MLVQVEAGRSASQLPLISRFAFDDFGPSHRFRKDLEKREAKRTRVPLVVGEKSSQFCITGVSALGILRPATPNTCRTGRAPHVEVSGVLGKNEINTSDCR